MTNTHPTIGPDAPSLAHLAGLSAGLMGLPLGQCPTADAQHQADWLAGHTAGQEMAAGIAADKARLEAYEQARAELARVGPPPYPAQLGSAMVPPPWAQPMTQRNKAK